MTCPTSTVPFNIAGWKANRPHSLLGWMNWVELTAAMQAAGRNLKGTSQASALQAPLASLWARLAFLS